MKITFSSIIEKNQDIHPRDLMNLVRYITDDCKPWSNTERVHVIDHSYRDNENKLMCTVMFTLSTGENRYLYIANRTKDFCVMHVHYIVM